MNPYTDSGVTEASLNTQNFFCLHFAHGCCIQGKNCKFNHHVPSLEDCQKIDLQRDIFGRTRFQSHRKDLTGVGSFEDSTRTLKFFNFCLDLSVKEYLIAGYEMIWRHVSPYGHIEEVFLFPSENICYIRFQHRCMAEFVKECLLN
jgi:hypothetical protein